MTCKELNLWLLATDLLASPPREVRSHIEGCGRCQQRHQRLLHLNETVRELPTPPARPDARARLLRGLDSAPGPRLAPWFRYRWHGLAGLAAALLLAVLGFAAVSALQQPQEVREFVVVQPTKKALPAAKPDVVGSVLERHLKLAKGLPEAERLRELLGLADDLRNESLRLAKAPASAELPAVAQLYQDVVRKGKLLERAEQLPPAEQKRLIGPLLQELKQSEAAGERLAATAPADVAATLRALTATTRELRSRLGKLVGEKTL